MSPALLKSDFGISFSSRSSSKSDATAPFKCTYRSADGDLTIGYSRYSSDQAARARFASAQSSLTKDAANAMDTTSDLTPVKLGGVGDVALRSVDGSVVAFVHGTDFVAISNGLPLDSARRMTHGMVALAHYVDHHL